jgi:hypothetical protein
MMNFDQLDELITKSIATEIDPHLYDAWARRVVAALSNDHVVRLYMQHINRQNAHNTRPEHAIGEQLWAVMQLASLAATRTEMLSLVYLDRKLDPAIASTFAYFMLHAQVYQWSDHCEELADAAPLPKHTISRNVMPTPIMFWSRQRSYIIHEPEYFETNWMLVMHGVDRMRILHDEIYGKRDSRRRAEFVLMDIPYGMIYPDDFGEGMSQNEIGRLLKRCSFLASPYTTHTAHGLPHHIRRQMQRSGQQGVFEDNKADVRVVALRRYRERKPPSGDHRHVDWRHKWWVTGHHRAQWYSKEKAHKVIWIAPYVKGPEDKPVLEKIYSVQR